MPSNNDKKKKTDEIFAVNRHEQHRTVGELMERSHPSPVYYTLLVLSSFIVTAGLLINNAAIVIGGMLVTPVLTPVLLISLGVSVGDLKVTKRVGAFVAKSFAVIVVAAFFLGIVFGAGEQPTIFLLSDSLRVAVLYFIVAIASGFAATYAWIHREISEILPGVAIAVSLVPPLALIGVGFSQFAFEVIRFNFFIFLFNFLGVLVGSLFVFSLMKFYKVEKKVEKEEEKVEKKEEKVRKEKEEKGNQESI